MNTFGNKHYTYINQIFGDSGVRGLISDQWPNKDYTFGVEQVMDSSGFEMSSHHHILLDAGGRKVWCSVDADHQNITIDINDTLCQSYTLLTYFNEPISSDKIERQMQMIRLYRKIISGDDLPSRNFREGLDGILKYKKNKKLWKIYPLKRPHQHVTKNLHTLLYERVSSVLDMWEAYGHWYFIGDGTCPFDFERDRNAALVAPAAT